MLHFAGDLAMNLKIPVTLLVVSDDLERAVAVLDEGQSYLEAYDVEVDIVLKDGEPAEEILLVARENDVNLIAMGAYGHNIREFIMGSITEHVMRTASCPILLYRY